jgi:DNA/RNA-binding domain of Phe-tRNA-synthetase-like protein
MKFSVDEELYRLFPGLRIGVLVLEVAEAAQGRDRLGPVIEGIQADFPFPKPQDHPHIKAWREAFGLLGVSASRYMSSIESLARRALKGGPFPRINPVVDLYNALSLKYLVPMGGHAVDPIVGDIVLGPAEGTETFMPMDGTEREAADRGEVVYRDAKEVLTRRWVWRQCDKDKVTEQTRTVFVPIDVLPSLPETLPQAVMDEMERWLMEDGTGRIIHRDVLTAAHFSTSF